MSGDHSPSLPSGAGLDESKTTELAFTLPMSLDTKIYLHVNNLANAVMVVLATTSITSTGSLPPLGNLVYAIPNVCLNRHRCNTLTKSLQRLEPSGQPLCTTLYARASSLDFVSRLARILAKKLSKPVYVGGEIKLWVQEDEAVALRGILDLVMKAVGDAGA